MKNKNLYQEKINRLESQIKKIEHSVATLSRDQAYVELDKAIEVIELLGSQMKTGDANYY